MNGRGTQYQVIGSQVCRLWPAAALAALLIPTLAHASSIQAEPAAASTDDEHSTEGRAQIPWAGTGGITVPEFRSRGGSEYPEFAGKAKIGASLILQILVKRDGSIESDKLLGCRVWKWGKEPDDKHSHYCPQLFEGVAETLVRTKYDPPLFEGRPIDAFYFYRYRLDKRLGKGPKEVWSKEELLAMLPPGVWAGETEAASRQAPARRGAALPADDAWLEARSNHFTIYSNGTSDSAQLLARRVEKLRAVLGQLYGGGSVLSPRPTWIYAFRDAVSFAPYTIGADLDGYFIESTSGNFVGLQTATGHSSTIFHEYLHYFLANNLPHVPLWLNEGMAELYSSIDIRDTEAQLGRPIPHHTYALKMQPLMAFDELFAITPDSSVYNESERRGVFYAQSWALVHYLLLGNPEMAAPLMGFLQRVGRGEPAGPAFEAAFELSYAAMKAQLAAYLEKDNYPTATIALGELSASDEIQIRQLGRAETLARLGALLIHTDPDHLDGPEGHFQAALELEPKLGLAHRGLGQVFQHRGELETAEAAFEKAVELDPQDDLARLHHARILFERVPAGRRTPGSQPDGISAEVLGQARRLLSEAVEIHPSRVDSHQLLGEVLAAGGSCPEGQQALKKAWQMMPSNMEMAGKLTAVLSMCGEHQKARFILDQFLRPHAAPDEVQVVEQMIVIAEVKELAASGKTDEAARLLESLLERTRDSRIRSGLEAILTQLQR